MIAKEAASVLFFLMRANGESTLWCVFGIIRWVHDDKRGECSCVTDGCERLAGSSRKDSIAGRSQWQAERAAADG